MNFVASSLGGCLLILEFVAADFVVESRASDLEDFCGAAQVPRTGLKHFVDMIFFDVFQRNETDLLGHARSGFRRGGEPEIFDINAFSLAKDHTALHQVAQLTNIPGPRIVQQSLLGRW